MITQHDVVSAFIYDTQTGNLIWREGGKGRTREALGLTPWSPALTPGPSPNLQEDAASSCPAISSTTPMRIDCAVAKADGDMIRLTIVCTPDFHVFTVPRHVAAAMVSALSEALV